jgi:hypothetical protein
MQRRILLIATALAPFAARAHHGWSSFDQGRPIWLEGKAVKVSWRNPHVEFTLEVPPDLKLPADLASRALPPQAAAVDGPALLKAAQLPTRRDRQWTVELAPLTRMQAWQVPEIQVGQQVGVLGFTFAGEKGDPVLRAEYLFVGDRAYGMRSSPA